jgi:hypothetical protein
MRGLVALAAVMSGLLLPVSSAAASCAAPQGGIDEQLKAVEAVFVGTVVGIPEDARLAEVAVEEVWQGEIDQVALVRGSPVAGNPDAGTSTDRQYSTGQRYLFAVDGRGSRFRDSSCSPTRIWTADLVRHRPAGTERSSGQLSTEVGSDTAAGTLADEPTPKGPWPFAVILVGTALLGALTIRRRRGHHLAPVTERKPTDTPACSWCGSPCVPANRCLAAPRLPSPMIVSRRSFAPGKGGGWEGSQRRPSGVPWRGTGHHAATGPRSVPADLSKGLPRGATDPSGRLCAIMLGNAAADEPAGRTCNPDKLQWLR